jgi:hypothetical protein
MLIVQGLKFLRTRASRYIYIAGGAEMGETSEWASGAGTRIIATDVLTELKLGSGQLLPLLIRRKWAAGLAIKGGMKLDDSDVESLVDEFFSDRGLFEKEQVQAWLSRNLIDEAMVRDFLREQALAARLVELKFTDKAVAGRFASNPHQYGRATIRTFNFPSEGTADEFILAVREKEIVPFADQSVIMKRDAPEEIASLLFAASPGDLVGPHETDEGLFRVYQVIQLSDATLDEAVSTLIRSEMLDELLKTELGRDPQVFLA